MTELDLESNFHPVLNSVSCQVLILSLHLLEMLFIGQTHEHTMDENQHTTFTQANTAQCK